MVIVAEHYLPGFRAGGPIRSIASLVDYFGHEIDFFVISRDRDAGLSQAYALPKSDDTGWVGVGKARVRYLSPRELNVRTLAGIINRVKPDAIYLNSVFAKLSRAVLLGRRLRLIDATNVLLAPRGELSPGALAIRGFKKRLFILASRVIGLHDGVTIHASTSLEQSEIRQVWRSKSILVAQNLTSSVAASATGLQKEPGSARFVYLSRIAPKKNLRFALDLLHQVDGNIELDIFGPISDARYWSECERAIAKLPSNVVVQYRGCVDPSEVVRTLATYHFFLLPTASENFGHAIVEALAAGCVPVISDQTPWGSLAAHGAGWTLRLDVEDWRRTLSHCIHMGDSEYSRLRASALEYVADIVGPQASVAHQQMLQSILPTAHQRLQSSSEASK